MIPIIVITESGESFNYFQGRLRIYDSENSRNPEYSKYGITHELTGFRDFKEGTNEEFPLTVFETDSIIFRDKVLEVLHEEAKECFNPIKLKEQRFFQVSIKEIIKIVKENLNTNLS